MIGSASRYYLAMTIHQDRIGDWDAGWRDDGPASAPVVLLLHALGQSSADWAGVSDALVREGYRVVAPDFRGHSRSGPSPAYSFEIFRDDVVALLSHLRVARAAVVGHSMGGTVAYLLAEQYPMLVSVLVFEDSPPPGGPALDPPATKVMEPFIASADPFDVAVMPAIGQQLHSPDPLWWQLLADIRCPALVIAGGAESQIDQRGLALVAEAIPGAELHTIGGGHYVHAKRQTEFVATLLDFLGRTYPAASAAK